MAKAMHGHFGSYDNLNKSGVPIRIDMHDLAKQVCAENYGFVRLLTAMCRVQRAKADDERKRLDQRGLRDAPVDTPLLDTIEKHLRNGDYR